MMNHFFALAGVLGGLVWAGLAIFPPDWGPPGTSSYEHCQLWNRIWAPALLGMGLGFYGFFRAMQPQHSRKARRGFIGILTGLAIMITGNLAEFWAFTDQPYGVLNARSIAWMMFLLGTLVMLICSAIAGLGMWKLPDSTKGDFSWRALSLGFILLLPLTAAAGVVNMSYAGTPLGILSIASGISILLSKRLIFEEQVGSFR